MNFCKENDKYISLYLDGLLDDNTRTELLKHIEICSECAAKLEETSYLVDLCREDQGINLPENFSSSLHKRLLAETAKDTKHKPAFPIPNKRLIAGLSTAAVLAISLLAYNLLPQIGSIGETGSIQRSNSQAYDTAQTNKSSVGNNGAVSQNSTDKTENAGTTSSNDNKDLANYTVSDKTASAKTKPNDQSDTNTATNDKLHATYDQKVSNDDLKNSKQSEQNLNDRKNADTSTKRAFNKPENDTFVYGLAAGSPKDTNRYVSNYAELNLKVSSSNSEISEFKNFMEKLGAVELKQDTADGISNSLVIDKNNSENNEDTSAAITMDTQLQSTAYIDYYFPLSLYPTIESEAAKYKLELSVKTDIIKDDVTDKYDLLNKQISEVDTKINEASKKGEDTSAFEAEKAKLTQEKDKIYSEKNMITVRIYYMP